MVKFVLMALLAVRSLGLLAPKSSIVVLGPGAFEVNLITAKMAAKAGYVATSVAVGTEQNANKIFNARALMYGKEYAKQEAPDSSKASVAMGVDAIASCLSDASGVVVCCDESTGPPSAGFVNALFAEKNSPKLESVALLSRIAGGVGGGLFAKSLAPGEAAIKKAAAGRGIPVSVVRAGVLKGGGPGKISREPGTAGTCPTDHGLDAHYYTTLVEYSSALSVMSYDQFCVGATVVNGDPYPFPNLFEATRTQPSFEARPYDASRTAVAGALLAALLRAEEADFTVSSVEGPTPPTFDEWNAMVKAALA